MKSAGPTCTLAVDWYVICYIWYSEEGTGTGPQPA